MFCKWCGNKIQLTDKKCQMCGRETPPVSDCGGFYDLKHAINPPARLAANDEEKRENETKLAEKLELLIVDARKLATKRYKAMGIGLIVVLLLSICNVLLLGSRMGAIEESISSMEQEIQNLITNNPSNECSCEPENPILAESEMNELESNVSQNEPSANMPDTTLQGATPINFEHRTNAELGDTAAFHINCSCRNEIEEVYLKTIRMEEGESLMLTYILKEGVTVKAEMKMTGKETGERLLGVKCGIINGTFENQECSCAWQYKDSLEQWVTVEEAGDKVDTDGYTYISSKEEWVSALCTAGQRAELRCVIQISDADGDFVRIAFEGIVLDEDGNITSDMEND